MRFTVAVGMTIPDSLVNALATRLKRVGEDPATLMPATVQSLQRLAEIGQAEWAKRITQLPGTEGRPLRLGTGPGDPMVRLNRSAYAESLRVTPVVVTQQGVQVSILTHDRQAGEIERGGPDIDLHAVLPYARKAYRSRKGNRYLRIPFRWATQEPGAQGQRFQTVSSKWGSNVLPAAVLAAMQPKRRYLITGTRREPSVNYPGKTVRRFLSTKPDPLKAKDLEALGISTETPFGHKLVGLLHVGRKGHGHYLTIRTLSEANPDGWRVPRYQARPIAQETARLLGEIAAKGWFAEAVRADVEAWTAQAGVAG